MCQAHTRDSQMNITLLLFSKGPQSSKETNRPSTIECVTCYWIDVFVNIAKKKKNSNLSE